MGAPQVLAPLVIARTAGGSLAHLYPGQPVVGLADGELERLQEMGVISTPEPEQSDEPEPEQSDEPEQKPAQRRR
ncbi:MAG: hypothetical protein ACRC0L_01315 [Angustibacter sp.]